MKYVIGVILLLVVGGGLFFFMNKNTSQQPVQTGTQQSASKNVVIIQGMVFSPPLLTVKVGESVTWTNQDSVGHSATANDNSFDTGILSNGQSNTVTFSKAGTFTYHCKVHPSMTGTIIVQ